MASAFEFNQAPGKGGAGGVSRQLATFAAIVRGKGSGKSDGGMSAKDTAGLMDKAHGQAIERAVAEHHLSEQANESARAHQTKINGAVYEAAQNPNIRSFNASTGSVTTTHPNQ